MRYDDSTHAKKAWGTSNWFLLQLLESETSHCSSPPMFTFISYSASCWACMRQPCEFQNPHIAALVDIVQLLLRHIRA